MTAQRFHLEPGMMTDVERHRASIAALPSDLEGLAPTVQGLLVHEAWAHAYGFAPPPERKREVSVRPAAQMLDEILELDSAPLQKPRPVERRMLGNCRDFTTLTCALLKQNGIPARAP
jgi:hypothetical protein